MLKQTQNALQMEFPRRSHCFITLFYSKFSALSNGARPISVSSALPEISMVLSCNVHTIIYDDVKKCIEIGPSGVSPSGVPPEIFMVL